MEQQQQQGGEIVAGRSPSRQLSELPKDELEHLAEEFGIDPTAFASRQHLVAAIHDRRQAIANMDRDAMLDVVKWGRRPVAASATKEQIAQEIARIRSMNFGGLSHRGLLVLSRMRGVFVTADEPVPSIVRKLKRQEGLFARINRKRRAVIGSLISKAIGEDDAAKEYQFVPPAPGTAGTPPPCCFCGEAVWRVVVDDPGGDRGGGAAGRDRGAVAAVGRHVRQPEARRD